MQKIAKFLGVVVIVAAFVVVGAVNADAAFTRDLTIGAQGSDVVELQDLLIAKGYLVMPAGVSKGYFGSLTAAALAKMQAAAGISPASGYFGPLTRAYVAKLGTSTTPTTPTTPSTSSLQGGDGDFKQFDVLGNPDNEDVEEGETVEVLAFEFEADDSDLLLERLSLVFEAQTGSTTKPWQVLDEVSVLVDGKEVASVDVSDSDEWSEEEDDQYSIDINDVDAVVKEGEEAKVEVAVTAQDNIDSEDLGDWAVQIMDDGVRAVNAEGINVYEGGADDVIDGDADEREFSLTEVETGSLDLSVDEDDDGNEDDQVDIDDSDETEEVIVYTFTAEAEDGDVMIEDVTVSFATTTGTTAALEDLIKEVVIEIDGDTFDESIDGVGTADVQFDDVDVDVSEDDEITIVVMVTVDATDDIDDWSDGDGIQVTEVVVDYIDGEDDDQSVTESQDGGEITFTESGLMVELASLSSTQGSDESKAEYKISFEVTAPEDDDIYIDLDSAIDSFEIVDAETGATTTATITSATLTVVNGATITSGKIKITEDNSATLRLTVNLDNDNGSDDISAQVGLTTLYYRVGSAGASEETYTAGLDEDFRTEEELLRTANITE